MRGMQMKSLWGGIAAGALLVTVGCGTQGAAGVQAQAAGQTGAPVVVSCEPHQRTLVRQTLVNGAAVQQIECIAAAPAAGALPAAHAQPVSYAPAMAQPIAAAPVRVAQPVYSELPDAQVVPARTAARPVRTRQVIYEEVPAKRSVTKSAVIIGSSAGVGAGVGAAVGGKKGALIGAAIGGGGAAIWDQATRRK